MRHIPTAGISRRELKATAVPLRRFLFQRPRGDGVLASIRLLLFLGAGERLKVQHIRGVRRDVRVV